MNPPRVVFDTNVVLSALVFRNDVARRLRHVWQSGQCLPLASTGTAQELLRVLAYPKFKLNVEEQHELLTEYLPFVHSVKIPQPPPETPPCRDPFDVAFLQLAMAGKAKTLVSGDGDLLALAGKTKFAIITPAQFLHNLPP
jgi:putative PIN family toxin of toxin-antitoxin system